MIQADTTYRTATDHQADLRQEATRAHTTLISVLRAPDPLPPTRGPLATLRHRLLGGLSFA